MVWFLRMGAFSSNDVPSSKESWFQISVQLEKKRLDTRGDNVYLQMHIPYCVSLIMVNITSHIFINIFKMVHFSDVKFARGSEQTMSFLLTSKSQKIWKKKLKQLDQTSLNACEFYKNLDITFQTSIFYPIVIAVSVTWFKEDNSNVIDIRNYNLTMVKLTI